LETIIIATIKEWNIANYFQFKNQFEDKYDFHLITDKDELSQENTDKLNPKYIFFPHWSWIIPKGIYSQYECIVFHMTDLPYGRGGSPFQNLIIREVYDTKISALRVTDGLDTGDIYIKEDFNISIGSAEENFIKLSSIVFQKMIPKFLDEKLIATQQEGTVTEFKRRKPKNSKLDIEKEMTLHKLYDFIRMLDAEGYPKAYIGLNNLKMELSEVHMKSGKLTGRFEVVENE